MLGLLMVGAMVLVHFLVYLFDHWSEFSDAWSVPPKFPLYNKPHFRFQKNSQNWAAKRETNSKK
jgi:hypothetical protein